MLITRKQAISRIYDVINSGIISEEIEEDLQQIANCIEHEEHGLFTWGADEEVIDLFVAMREDLITDEWIRHCDEVYEKYKIKPVEFKGYFEEGDE